MTLNVKNVNRWLTHISAVAYVVFHKVVSGFLW